MKALAYLILCFVPLAIASGGQSAEPLPGKVTLVYFWAAWCGPCKALSPALQQIASGDADVALKKINADEESPAELQAEKVSALPVVKVYNREGELIGTVTGADAAKVKSYVKQAKSSSDD